MKTVSTKQKYTYNITQQQQQKHSKTIYIELYKNAYSLYDDIQFVECNFKHTLCACCVYLCNVVFIRLLLFRILLLLLLLLCSISLDLTAVEALFFNALFCFKSFVILHRYIVVLEAYITIIKNEVGEN